jgi:exodeoxyribonuclease VII large subunit
VQVRRDRGFSQAASGHCYFSLKDAQGQIRCAMFRRAAQALTTLPREGDQVEVQGRLGVYEARGDLQLVVEVLRRAGQGALYEQFLQRKARLQALGLFDASRKRALPRMPRGVGVVTSLGAAALHDVAVARYSGARRICPWSSRRRRCRAPRRRPSCCRRCRRSTPWRWTRRHRCGWT